MYKLSRAFSPNFAKLGLDPAPLPPKKRFHFGEGLVSMSKFEGEPWKQSGSAPFARNKGIVKEDK
jgi:hypothetical protein